MENGMEVTEVILALLDMKIGYEKLLTRYLLHKMQLQLSARP